jgi:hypothetical protein
MPCSPVISSPTFWKNVLFVQGQIIKQSASTVVHNIVPECPVALIDHLIMYMCIANGTLRGITQLRIITYTCHHNIHNQNNIQNIYIYITPLF